MIFFFTKVVFKVLILFLLLFSVLPSLSIPQRDWIFRYLETANKCIFKRQIDFFRSNIQCSFEVIIQLHIQQLVHSLFIAQFFHLLPILYPPSTSKDFFLPTKLMLTFLSKPFIPWRQKKTQLSQGSILSCGQNCYPKWYSFFKAFDNYDDKYF